MLSLFIVLLHPVAWLREWSEVTPEVKAEMRAYEEQKAERKRGL